MAQKIIVIAILLVVAVYIIYKLVKFFMPGKKVVESNKCDGCDGCELAELFKKDCTIRKS